VLIKNDDKYSLPDDFFGKNITVSAIVGKNGSGKSSLLELIYRMVYNISVKMGLLTSSNSNNPTFIPLNAEIYFVANNQFYGLKNDNESVYFYKQEFAGNFKLDAKWDKKIENEDKRLLAEFFYSIVVNYSIHSFTYDNAYDDPYFAKLDRENMLKKYSVPISFNPNRILMGSIDMMSELRKIEQQLIVMLDANLNFIEGYTIRHNEFNFKEDTLNINQTTFDNICNSLLPDLPFDMVKNKIVIFAYRYIVNRTLNTLNSNIDEAKKDVAIKQSLNFIKYAYNKSFAQDMKKDLKTIRWDYLSDSKLPLYQRIEFLPPPFYTSNIVLEKNADSQSVNKSEIKLSEMSSGERQLIFSNAAICYHIVNLIRETNYKHFNIILDEIELCFHPEYQREFVQRLLGYLDRIVPKKDKNKYHFNIILSTHSPFILSDIPNCNIMYLEEGKQKKQKKNTVMPETFSANIHDILRHGFFLEKGFIGDFAQKKIKEILDVIEQKRKNRKNKCITKKEYEKFKDTIDLIGEPLIKTKLMMMIGEVYGNPSDFIQLQKDMWQREIEKLNDRDIQLKNQ
jgi:predicted ATPase